MQKKIVVIGGGTGTSVVLNGLKNYPELELTAIVNVSDSGGSTGRLRDEFGFLPVGDARQCLAALSDGKYSQQLRDLLLYRFEKGGDLKGHNLGNLILTALEDQVKSPAKAIELASKLFRLRGRVLPITEENVQLVIEYENGQVLIGEHNLDNPQLGGKKITKIKLSPYAQIYNKAYQAIVEADFIILGPGDLYASLLANACVNDFAKAINNSKAKFIYIANLMTHYTQTHQMTAKQHLQEVAEYCQRQPEIIIVNNQEIDQKTIDEYAKNKEYPVIDDLEKTKNLQIIKKPLLSSIRPAKHSSDIVPRSVLRHDTIKLAKILYNLCK